MIEILKSLPSVSALRLPLATAASLTCAALAPLFVISTRVLTEPSDRSGHALSAAPPDKPAVQVKHAPALEPRLAGAHWRQLAQGIEGRLQAVRRTAELQAAALVLVDAADFTLAGIIEELTAVMPRAAELRAYPRPRLVSPQALAA